MTTALAKARAVRPVNQSAQHHSQRPGHFQGPGASVARVSRAEGSWPGAVYGIRRPMPGEVVLSWQEVHCARRAGVL